MSYSRFERSSHFFHTEREREIYLILFKILLHFFIELLSLQHLGASFDDGGDGYDPQRWRWKSVKPFLFVRHLNYQRLIIN